MGAQPQQVFHRLGELLVHSLVHRPTDHISQSIDGTFSSQADIAPSNTRTYYSQNTFELPLGDDVLYAGDRWRPSLLGSSRYIWLPLTFDSGKPQLVWADVWSVDINAGK